MHTVHLNLHSNIHKEHHNEEKQKANFFNFLSLSSNLVARNLTDKKKEINVLFH